MNKFLKIVTVIAIIKYRNKFLLVQRTKNDNIFPSKWQNVGGKVEPNEKVEEAIFREIREEIGVLLDKSTKLEFVMSYSWIKGPNEPVRLGLIFLIKPKFKPKNILLCDELENYGWYTFDEITKLETISPKSATGTIAQISAVT